MKPKWPYYVDGKPRFWTFIAWHLFDFMPVENRIRHNKRGYVGSDIQGFHDYWRKDHTMPFWRQRFRFRLWLKYIRIYFVERVWYTRFRLWALGQMIRRLYP